MYFYGGICLWINIDVEYVVIHTIPEKGESRNNTAPGTDFEDLPEKWFCPSCGASKIRFRVTKRP